MENKITVYFVRLNIDLFSRISIITELRQKSATEAQNFRQLSGRRATN